MEKYPVLHLDLNAEKYDSKKRLENILSNQAPLEKMVMQCGNEKRI